MKSSPVVIANLLALILSCIAAKSLAAGDSDWPTFRGPQRTAVATDANLLTSWPESGPRLIWEAAGAGRGYASIAIAGDKLFTLGDALSTRTGEDEYLSAYDRETGKQLWATKTGPAWKEMEPDWHNSRSTPTVSDGMVYVITPKGVLVACKVNDGAEVWRKDLVGELEGKKDDPWGYSESVLVDGDNLICTPGGNKATMVALNKLTGELVWKAVRPDDIGAGHASIVISEVASVRVYVQTTGSGAIGVSAKDGTVLWSYPIDKTTAVIPTPIVRGDLVFFSVGYGRGGALLQQVAGANGEVTIKEIYGLNPKLSNRHGGVILIGDYLYGDADDNGTPFCAELMTGIVKWKGRGPGNKSAVVIGGGDMLYMQFQDGVIALVKADPSEFTVVSQFKIPGSGARPSWAHPAILDGRLYVRSQDQMFCYDLTPSPAEGAKVKPLVKATPAFDVELNMSNPGLWTKDTVHLGTKQVDISYDATDNAAVMTPTWSANDVESDDVGVRNVENGRLQLYQAIPAKDCTQAESAFEINIPQAYIDEGKLELVFALQAGAEGDYLFNGRTFTMQDFAGKGGTYKQLIVGASDYNEPLDKLRSIERISFIFERRGSLVSAPVKIRRVTIDLNSEKITPPAEEERVKNPKSQYEFTYTTQEAIDGIEVRVSAESMDITRQLSASATGMVLIPQWKEGQIPDGHSGSVTIVQPLGAVNDFERFEAEYVLNIPKAYFDEGKLQPWVFIQAGEKGYYRWSGTPRPLESFAGEAGTDIVFKVTQEDFLEGKKRNQIEMVGLQLNRNGSTVTEPIMLKRITVKLPETVQATDEMLSNGDFSSGNKNWEVEEGEGATAKVETAKEGPDGASSLRLEVVTVPDESWKIQMYQSGLKVEKDQQYVLTFWAKSNKSGAFKAICMQNHDPWEHATEKEILVSSEWKQYEFTFNGPWDDDDARITFTDLATDVGRVYWFANCSLMPVTEKK